MANKLKLLLVDDDDIDRMAVRRALRGDHFDVSVDEANTATSAFETLQSNQYDCVILDYMLPDGSGLSVLEKLRDKDIKTPVVILTGQADERLIVKLLRAGASDYIAKSRLTSDTLFHCIETSIRLHKADIEKQQAKEDLNQSHEQLLQSEKMASIGQLAAGVAHEINNPVGYVYSNLGTLHRYIGELCQLLDSYEKLETLVPAEHEHLTAILKLKEHLDIDYLKQDVLDLLNESCEGISRVKGIVQDLKDFSYVDKAEWQWVDLHKGLDSTLNIVNNEIKYKAEVIKEYGDLPLVECVASQLNQVFLNLLVNSAQAIEDHGTITLRTGTKIQDETNFVWIEISDTGKGICEDDLVKIFEPFYTTKEVGKGTGLGLSLSYGIMKKHQGKIEVQSEPGAKTTFRVWLPVQRDEQQMSEQIFLKGATA